MSKFFLSLVFFLHIFSFCHAIDLTTLPWGTAKHTEVLLQIVPEQPYILEAGARHGEDTKWFAENWPLSYIYAFEANPEYFSIIEEEIANCSNISFFQYGLAERTGDYEFYISRCIFGANSLFPSSEENENIYGDEKIPVYCRNLDEWYEEENVKQIDLIWFDLEGAELEVLKSAPKVLEKTSIIYTEVNFQEFRKGMAQFEEIYSFLIDKGFFLYHICGNPSVQADAIFVKNNENFCSLKNHE